VKVPIHRIECKDIQSLIDRRHECATSDLTFGNASAASHGSGAKCINVFANWKLASAPSRLFSLRRRLTPKTSGSLRCSITCQNTGLAVRALSEN
jgi:hypothetical protein